MIEILGGPKNEAYAQGLKIDEWWKYNRGKIVKLIAAKIPRWTMSKLTYSCRYKSNKSIETKKNIKENTATQQR